MSTRERKGKNLVLYVIEIISIVEYIYLHVSK